MQASNRREKRTGGSEVRWQVTTATGCRFACTVHTRDAHIEVRLTTGDDQLVYATVAATPGEASRVAQRWLRLVLANGTVDAGHDRAALTGTRAN